MKCGAKVGALRNIQNFCFPGLTFQRRTGKEISSLEKMAFLIEKKKLLQIVWRTIPSNFQRANKLF